MTIQVGDRVKLRGRNPRAKEAKGTVTKVSGGPPYSKYSVWFRVKWDSHVYLYTEVSHHWAHELEVVNVLDRVVESLNEWRRYESGTL